MSELWLAPIVLFVYNRPDHTRQTLEALMANELADQSELFIYADGPKTDADRATLAHIHETREVIRAKQWCKKTHIVESDINKGLTDSIVQGVTEIVNQYGKIIVLEDDIVTSRGFLKYMNEGLRLYQHVSNVYTVSGYIFPIPYSGKKTSVLLPLISTWGWATWKEKWVVFDYHTQQSSYIINNVLIQKRFNIADYNYVWLLKNKGTSWGIRWYYSVFVRNGLGVFPTKNLVDNIGYDGTGTNCGTETRDKLTLHTNVEIFFTEEIDLEFYANFLNYFTKISEPAIAKTNIARSAILLTKKIIKYIFP